MRYGFREQLDEITTRLSEILGHISKLMQRASTALLSGNIAIADQVIAEYPALAVERNDLEALALRVMVQQAPVARDLRTVLSAFHINTELERMGALSLHIARIAAGTAAIGTLPEVLPTLNRAANHAARISSLTTRILQTRDLELVPQIQQVEDAMDRVRVELFRAALAPKWPHGIETCIRLTEAARYYERYADHAVEIAEQVGFIVTGKPE
ncbi:MAG: hypothetical protein INR66_23870 [Gordonia polyisoprenivorans]|nr:hypothetical protein [Gordonia polyisoprenivorans]